jgi:hypothetical protein
VVSGLKTPNASHVAGSELAKANAGVEITALNVSDY